jgi:hypothetical protein
MSTGISPIIEMVTFAAATLLMVLAGRTKKMLVWKTPKRRCPSCGADLRDCRCRR